MSGVRQLHPRFLRDPTYNGTIFREIAIYPDRLSLTPAAAPQHTRRCTVEVLHWPIKTMRGHPDFRYNPRHQVWSLGEFVKLLGAAVKAGDWGAKESKPRAEVKSALFTIDNDTIELSAIHLRDGDAYLNVWPHHPLYKRTEFQSLVTAADQLNEIRKELARAKRNR